MRSTRDDETTQNSVFIISFDPCCCRYCTFIYNIKQDKMYGGLFGDLPATKASSKKSDDPQKQEQNTETTKISKVSEPSSIPKLALQAPSSAKPKNVSENNQMLKAIGNAGTSLSFVPAAARRKKRPRPLTTPVATAASTTEAKVEVATSKVVSKTIDKVDTSSIAFTSTWEPSVVMTTNTKIIPKVSTTANNNKTLSMGEQKDQSSTRNNNHSHQSQEQDNEKEEEEIVVEIKDVYDPYVPNDLLQYWERQSLIRERQAMEREAKEALERQQMLRKKLEQEREELQRKGDYAKLLQPLQTDPLINNQRSGGGRGRGVSNLPAWLIAQKRKEEELGDN